MKFITFIEDGLQKAGITSKDMKSVHSFTDVGLNYSSMLDFIRFHNEDDISKLKDIETTTGTSIDTVQLVAPIPNPHHDIICLGLNYMDHVMESKSATKDTVRSEAIYFSKRVIEAVGPNGYIESHNDIMNSLDYEAEMAVVIGKDAKGIKKENAWDYVFGLMSFNDVSAREIQHKHNQWYFGKSLDSFTAFGPWIVSLDEFSFPIELNVVSRVNGEVRQNNNTRNMIFPVDYVIEELSSGITLDKGTIIATGTPSGVAAGFNPPKFMKPGDICEIEIEGCGILRNNVR